jgi:CRISPR/Cas system-associated endoribonuclease Cas2
MKAKKLFDEQLLVPQAEQDSMKLKILEEILENALYYEQYSEIMCMVNEELVPKLRERHLELKNSRQSTRQAIRDLDREIKEERNGRGTDW